MKMALLRRRGRMRVYAPRVATASFPRRRAYIDHQSVGDPNFSSVSVSVQAVHHGGVICGLGARARPRPAESLSRVRVALDLRRERVGRTPDYT